ncbi:MAG: hypothetical protein IJM80_06470 [Firmicutes bacterium]|nr:hypothetical protein [Bacillota bacterium]
MENRRPKIWIIVLIVLTAAALVFTFAGASSLRASADRVEYVKTASQGDPSAADGISVIFSNDARRTGIVRWITTLSVAEGTESISAGHRYMNSSDTFQGESDMDRIALLPSTDTDPAIIALAEKAARDIPAGSYTQIKVRLADHMEYLPLRANYSVGAHGYNSRNTFNAETKQTETTDKVDSVLNGLFRIKVPEDLIADISVSRHSDRDGDIDFDFYVTGYEGYGNIQDYLYGLIFGRYYDGAFYIYQYFNPDYAEYYGGPEIRTLSVEGPQKIYRIPVKSTGTSDITWHELDTDNITVTGEYPEGTEYISAGLAADGSRALLLGSREGRFTAYIADFAQGGKLQTIDLCEAAETDDTVVIIKDDMLFLGIKGRGWYVVYPDGGRYRAFFAATDGRVESAELWRNQKNWSYRYYPRPFDVSFSGGRLAVASFAGDVFENVVDGQTYKGFRGNGMSLAVYTEAGLQYYTRYKSSLFDLSYALINPSGCSVEVVK